MPGPALGCETFERHSRVGPLVCHGCIGSPCKKGFLDTRADGHELVVVADAGKVCALAADVRHLRQDVQRRSRAECRSATAACRATTALVGIETTPRQTGGRAWPPR